MAIHAITRANTARAASNALSFLRTTVLCSSFSILFSFVLLVASSFEVLFVVAVQNLDSRFGHKTTTMAIIDNSDVFILW